MTQSQTNIPGGQQPDTQKKLQKLVLDLNKAGLSNLTQRIIICNKNLDQFEEAIQMFKKSQKLIYNNSKLNEPSRKMIQLSGITFNNLACYYKKTKKPKVALKYLKKALELQVFQLNNWISIAGTHLNICAIYSYLKNHEQAAGHAQLAINFLDKVKYDRNDGTQQGKSYWNVLMLSYYNLAIEKQYLKDYQTALQLYQKSKGIAVFYEKKNNGVIGSCQQSIERIKPLIKSLQKKLNDQLKRKQIADQKGFREFMKRNKRHFSVKRDQSEDQISNYIERIARYNFDVVSHSCKNISGSTGKFRSRMMIPKSNPKQSLYRTKQGLYKTFRMNQDSSLSSSFQQNRTVSGIGKLMNGRKSTPTSNYISCRNSNDLAPQLPRTRKVKLLTEQNSSNFDKQYDSSNYYIRENHDMQQRKDKIRKVNNLVNSRYNTFGIEGKQAAVNQTQYVENEEDCS